MSCPLKKFLSGTCILWKLIVLYVVRLLNLRYIFSKSVMESELLPLLVGGGGDLIRDRIVVWKIIMEMILAHR